MCRSECTCRHKRVIMSTDDLNEFLCDCMNVATHFCPTHNQYLCQDELSEHKCRVQKLGETAAKGADNDTSVFSVNTQILKDLNESAASVVQRVRGSLSSSLEAISASLSVLQTESDRIVAISPNGKKNPVQHELKVGYSFLAIMDSMAQEFAKHLKVNEQLITTSIEKRSILANFLTKSFAQASKELNNMDAESLEPTVLVDDSKFVKMDYSLSQDSARDSMAALERDEINESVRAVEITEFKPIFQKQSLRPADDGAMLAMQMDDLVFEDDEDLGRSERIQDRFHECKNKLFRVMDQALFDVSCPNFFDRRYTDLVNDYLDQFKKTIDQVMRELKNSFNKL